MTGPAEFSRVRWRAGYDPEEVDAFMERLLATLERRPVATPVTADEVRNIAFSSVRLREGYAAEEVDQFLDQAETWLTQPQR